MSLQVNYTDKLSDIVFSWLLILPLTFNHPLLTTNDTHTLHIQQLAQAMLEGIVWAYSMFFYIYLFIFSTN